MSVAQPQILLVLNDASGTTVTNDGSVATDAAIGQGVEDTDWAWHSGEGSFDGYWESLDNQGSDQAWIDATGIALSASITHVWGAIGFNLTSYDTVTNQGYLYAQAGSNSVLGGLYARAQAPTTAGSRFNLLIGVSVLGGQDRQHIFEDLDFGTDYQVVFAVDATTAATVTAKYKLNGGSVTAVSGSDNFGGQSYQTTGGYVGRGSDFSNYRGLTGNIYYVAVGRGTLLSDQDMTDINTDPAATITGWPSIGGPVHPFTSVTVTG